MSSRSPSTSTSAPHLPVARALQGSEVLASLMQRLQMSRARLQAIAPLLPEGLQGAVQAGPLDDKAWSLLVANAAAAAKLRQMLPQLQAALQAQGFVELTLRLKVQGRRP